MRTTLHVALHGDDAYPGTEDSPLATLEGARDAVRRLRESGRVDGPVEILLGEGTYYLKRPLVLGPEDSGTEDAPVTYAAKAGGRVTLSGGRRLECEWEPHRDGIMMCRLPEVSEGGLGFTQLFVNGRRQTLARWPDADPSDPEGYSGYALAAGRIANDVPDPCPDADADMTFSGGPPRGIVYDPETFTGREWARPAEAVVHIYQAHYWGNLQWRLRHLDREKHRIWFGEGGQQMGAKWYSDPSIVNERSRFFVENVLEELDAPGEWYLDAEEGVLYLMPEEGVDLEDALVEAPALKRVIELRGSRKSPVRHVSFRGFRIAHTASTFLDKYEIPSLSDWSVHRGGAVFLEGTRDCAVADCWFDAPGGNAVFMNEYNRGNTVKGCTFSGCGDSAVCFVGSLERTVGSQKAFPYECRAENNRISRCGVFGKQVAGVYISRAKRITASHNLIHEMPRACICIGDGTWGGHVIEYNRIHDTCRETGDHGPFNAWGRDRGWCLAQSHGAHTAQRSHDASEMMVDAMEPVIVRNNFFEERAGWGLDLDDGASNYEIYNNLCVGVSMKLREGCHRTIYNNIWVNGANSPCFHIGNEDNHDRYFRNITVMSIRHCKPENDLNFAMGASYGEIYTLIRPPIHGPWLEEIDHNCFFSDAGEFVARAVPREEESRKYTLEEWRELGFDRHSVFADPMFVDPEHNDYRVRDGSPALSVGFENFEMGAWGLTDEFPHGRWPSPGG